VLAARHAHASGKPVMALPGPVTSALSAGPHALIRDHDARLVTSADDATQELTKPGNRRSDNVREVSVGDPLKVTDEPHAAAGHARFYAVTSAGFHTVPEPANPIVPLAGTTATSRT
jgi:predicted Rossmann fold nucleotide-binding protein DprA/Smf involved in DNA uptake